MQDLYCTGQDIYTETGQDTEDPTSPALMVVSPLTTTCQYVFVNIASKKVRPQKYFQCGMGFFSVWKPCNEHFLYRFLMEIFLCPVKD